MAKRSITPILFDSFTNRDGHTFMPGDKAIAVTSGGKSAHLKYGFYVGIRYRKNWSSKIMPYVVMEVMKTKRKFLHKVTGSAYDFKKEKHIKYPSYPPFTADRVAYTNALNKYQKDREKFQKDLDELRKDYEWRNVEYVGQTTLQLNKIYPANIALRDW